MTQLTHMRVIKHQKVHLEGSYEAILTFDALLAAYGDAESTPINVGFTRTVSHPELGSVIVTWHSSHLYKVRLE